MRRPSLNHLNVPVASPARPPAEEQQEELGKGNKLAAVAAEGSARGGRLLLPEKHSLKNSP